MVALSGSDAGFAVLGGFFISLASTLHVFISGRVTGYSGMLFSLITLDKKSFFCKVPLLAVTLWSGAFLWLMFGTDPFAGNSVIFETPAKTITNLSFLGFGIGGLLVGIGAKL